MKGIDCAFVGRLARDPEPRTTKAGRPMAVLNLAVDEGGDDDVPPTWVKVLVFEPAPGPCAALGKGGGVYAEGRQRAEPGRVREGGPGFNLPVLARQVVPMGQMGRRRPAAGPPARASA